MLSAGRHLAMLQASMHTQTGIHSRSSGNVQAVRKQLTHMYASASQSSCAIFDQTTMSVVCCNNTSWFSSVTRPNAVCRDARPLSARPADLEPAGDRNESANTGTHIDTASEAGSRLSRQCASEGLPACNRVLAHFGTSCPMQQQTAGAGASTYLLAAELLLCFLSLDGPPSACRPETIPWTFNRTLALGKAAWIQQESSIYASWHTLAPCCCCHSKTILKSGFPPPDAHP